MRGLPRILTGVFFLIFLFQYFFIELILKILIRVNKAFFLVIRSNGVGASFLHAYLYHYYLLNNFTYFRKLLSMATVTLTHKLFLRLYQI